MKSKVLVVDDEKTMQDLLKNTFLLSGFEVFVAGNESEFREHAFSVNPDVIILDLMLGDKDGAQVYGQLLADGLNSNIPVIFISALAQDRPPTPPRPDRKYALVGKPFDPEELVDQIGVLLKARKAD